MDSFLTGIRETVVVKDDGKHGPLPLLLLGMTVVTGLVDSFSYLALGHVFVANATGNVVFLGFAVAGAPGFSIAASLVALGAFGLGAFIGGTIGSRLGRHRGRLLSTAATIQSVFVAGAVVLAAISASPVAGGYRYALIVALAVAMGIQNATARKLAVPDLTTTVLTLTITGLAADSVSPGAKGSVAGRRLISMAAMLAGALVGAALVVHGNRVYGLVIALLVTVAVAATAHILGSSDPTWVVGESAGD